MSQAVEVWQWCWPPTAPDRMTYSGPSLPSPSAIMCRLAAEILTQWEINQVFDAAKQRMREASGKTGWYL